MPRQLETRKVSISKWYKPWSWGKFVMEWRYIWRGESIFDETKEFVTVTEWKQTAPPVFLIIGGRCNPNASYHYANEDCKKTIIFDQDERLHLALTIMQAESNINRANDLLSNGFNPEAIREDLCQK